MHKQGVACESDSAHIMKMHANYATGSNTNDLWLVIELYQIIILDANDANGQPQTRCHL